MQVAKEVGDGAAEDTGNEVLRDVSMMVSRCCDACDCLLLPDREGKTAYRKACRGWTRDLPTRRGGTGAREVTIGYEGGEIAFP